MKKQLLILAVAATALAACTNDETVEVNKGEAISFRPLVNNVTRAADVTQATMTSFVVNAFEGSTTTPYFANATFSNGGSGQTYTSTPKYYWPSSGNLDFYAYAPAGNDQVTYTDYKTFVIQPSTTIADQVDLVYACIKGQNKESNGSGVELNFRHTGAKIVCKVKNSSAALKFDVVAWKVGYLDTEGKFIFADDNTVGNNTGAGTTLTPGQWSENTTQSVDNQYSSTDLGTAQTIVAYNSSDADPEHTYAFTQEMIVVPQTINKATKYAHSGATAAGDKLDGSFIAVKLKIFNAANSARIAPAADEYVWAIWPIGGTSNSFSWDPGKCYTYTIDLAGGGYYEVNQTETPAVDEDLDQILDGAEIKFVNVTVDDWTPVAKTVPES